MQETFWTLRGCPLRIALVSDTHERPFGEIVSSLRARAPELICVAGDFVHGAHKGEQLKMEATENALRLLRLCAGIAPTFASLGNHEWMLEAGDLRLIEASGVRLLDNTWTVLQTERAPLVIGGLSSARYSLHRRLIASGADPDETLKMVEKLKRRTPPERNWLRDYCAEPGYHILLCHHPEYYPRYLRRLPIELVLSGHAHGGQVRLFGQGLYAPGQGPLPKLTAGVHEGRLVVSRGLANNEPVPRLFNEPELVYILPE